MGRKNKSYSKDLHQQVYDRLVSMQSFGQSKRADRLKGESNGKIYSINTFKTYYKHAKYFTKYISECHPECTTLNSCRKYVNEWLDKRADEGLSAWTIQTEAKALAKLYGISPEDNDYYCAPQRNRANIVRSRYDTSYDSHFSVGNHLELVKFCKNTGLRRSELASMTKDALLSKDDIAARIKELEGQSQKTIPDVLMLNAMKDAMNFNESWFLYVKGKGGRIRISPILKTGETLILERINRTMPNAKIFEYIPKAADIHSYRSEYATAIYKLYARPLNKIPYDKIRPGINVPYQSGVYHCRKDESGKRLDKAAMIMASKALGHNRIEIVANNYIRGL